MGEQIFLLVSWGTCWFFFLYMFARGPFSPARSSPAFRKTTYLVFGLLAVWSACMWIMPATPPSFWWALFWAACTLVGQGLMCTARRALPLSNKDVVLGIAMHKVTAGPYRYVAHPMYVGLTLALLGSAAILGNIPALLLLVIIVAALLLRTYTETNA